MIKTRWISEFGIETLICNRCGHDKHYNIQLHHKKYIVNGGETHPKNLEPLCRNCHGEEHYENGYDSDFGEKQQNNQKQKNKNENVGRLRKRARAKPQRNNN